MLSVNFYQNLLVSYDEVDNVTEFHKSGGHMVPSDASYPFIHLACPRRTIYLLLTCLDCIILTLRHLTVFKFLAIDVTFQSL